MESSIDYDHLSDVVQPGHVYAVVAPQGNKEGSNYWLAQCVQGKKKITKPMADDDGFMYPTGSIFFFQSWLHYHFTIV